MFTALDTGISKVKNVAQFIIGDGSLKKLGDELLPLRSIERSSVLFFVDHFFSNVPEFIGRLPVEKHDAMFFIDTTTEPPTEQVDDICTKIRDEFENFPVCIVGIGGGSTMDIAKAVSNLMTNDGRAEDYQGWDLVKKPGIYKIAVPTIAGTGAEATRTCVMTNRSNGLKLGMNSDHTVYDQVILDPSLLATVPRDQYFYTGMDAYIHCIEALSGNYRNAIGDALSLQVIGLCREIFLDADMMRDEAREKLMVASYLGGCAIATSYVGVVHPLSAGLSVVLGTHHCVANCSVMRSMEKYYPIYFEEFWEMAANQKVDVPIGVCNGLSDEQFDELYRAATIHEKPLTNALGPSFKRELTAEKVRSLYKMM